MNASLRVLVVDDETHARRRLLQFLAEESDVAVVGEAAHGLEAVEAIETLAPDLVLLDVEMPELDGFGVVEAVGLDRMPATLFITAHDRFALPAFEANALDYLLKPVDPDRFRRALAKARTWLGRGQPNLQAQLKIMLDHLSGARKFPERLLVRTGERRHLVNVADLQWVEAEGNYVRLHAVGSSYLMRESMKGIEGRLDPAHFRRIHRSSLVNLNHIDQLQPWFGGDYLVLMRDGSRLTLSRTFKSSLQDLL